MSVATKGPVLTAYVRDGRMSLTAAQQERITSWLRGLEGKQVTVKLERFVKHRSLAANRRYWAILGQIAEETGAHSEDLHLVFRERFLPRKFITLGGKDIEVPKTTTTLSNSEFSAYVEQVIAEVANYGISIQEI